MSANLDDLLDVVSKLDQQAVAWDLKKLRAVRDWALAQQAVKVGDMAVICDSFHMTEGSAPGWWMYRESLRPGALVEVLDVDYSSHLNDWIAGVYPTPCWSVSTFKGGRRFPKSRTQFGLRMSNLRPACEHDKPLVMPTEASS